MNNELEAKLLERFPKLLRLSYYTGRYVRCQDGWFVLLWMFLQDVEAKGWDIEFVTVKEKWGYCHVYPAEEHFPFSGSDKVAPTELWEMLDKLGQESWKTCEFCGQPGKCRYEYSWYRTLCDECVKEYDQISPITQFGIPEMMKQYVYPRGTKQWKDAVRFDDDSFATFKKINLLPNDKPRKVLKMSPALQAALKK